MSRKTDTANSAWGKVVLSPDDTFEFHCGPVTVSVRSEHGELLLASGEDVSEAEPTRWALPGRERELVFAPALPNLPVLVEPESPFHLLPGASARVYLAIPVTVVAKAEVSGAVLHEIPSSVLSQTWFGELESGELCYRLPTALSREAFKEPKPDRITAPVQIRNDSTETLPVTRLCLRVSHLAVYCDGEGLWTSETEVRFQGGSKASRISVQTGPPKEASGAVLVGAAREAGPVGKVGRSFRSLRKWTKDLLDVD